MDIHAELDPEDGEIVEAPASEVEPLPSRRRVLSRALGGIGAIIAAAFARSTTASAATGDPILIGRRNLGGSASTELFYDGPGGGGLFVRSRSDAIRAESFGDGRGLHGIAAQNAGVVGESHGRSHGITTAGVIGTNDFVVGVKGISVSGVGTEGISTSQAGVHASSTSGPGAVAVSRSGRGLFAVSTSGPGVDALSTSGPGVKATSFSDVGVAGTSTRGPGVTGTSSTGVGVRGRSVTNDGVVGHSTSGAGMVASSQSGVGLHSTSLHGDGVVGISTASPNDPRDAAAIFGQAFGAIGVHGISGHGGTAVLAENNDGQGGIDVGLEVDGLSKFLTSGVGTVPSGSTTGTVSVSFPLMKTRKILCTLVDDPGNSAVLHWVEVGTESFTVHLTQAPAADVDFAWFVIT